MDEAKKPGRDLTKLTDNLRNLVEMAQWRGEQLVWKNGVTNRLDRVLGADSEMQAAANKTVNFPLMDKHFHSMTLLESLETHTAVCDETYRLMLDLNRSLKAGTKTPDTAHLDRQRAAVATLESSLAQVRNAASGLRRPSLRIVRSTMPRKCQRTILKALLLDRGKRTASPEVRAGAPSRRIRGKAGAGERRAALRKVSLSGCLEGCPSRSERRSRCSLLLPRYRKRLELSQFRR